MRLSTTLTSLVPCVAAFYPYFPERHSFAPLAGSNHRIIPPPPRHPHLRSRSPANSINSEEGGRRLTFPISRRRGVKAKRENDFSIVPSKKPTFPRSAAVDQDGTDFIYIVSMTLGGNGAEFYMLIDTAAPSSWIMGSSCTSDSCALHSTFGSEDGRLSVQSANPFSVTYGTGSVSGTLCSTTAELAGMSTALTLGLADKASDEFSYYPMDGILGLGITSAVPDDARPSTPLKTPNFLDLLASSGAISRNLFAVRLSRASSGTADGELNLGATNPALHTGPLAWHSAIASPRGFWELAMSGAAVGGSASKVTFAPIKGSVARSAILDTGTSFILTPPEDAEALHSLVSGTKALPDGEQWSVPCDTETPIFLFFISSSGVEKRWRIEPSDYVGTELDDQPGNCVSNIIGRTTFKPRQWLVGDVFLKNVYAVFDKDNARIGFGIPSSGVTVSSRPSQSPTPGSGSAGGKSGKADGTTTGTRPSRTHGGGGFSEVSALPDSGPDSTPKNGKQDGDTPRDGGAAIDKASRRAIVVAMAGFVLGRGLA